MCRLHEVKKMLFSWKPDTSLKSPMYMQLADYFRAKIKMGDLKNGTKLPGRETLMESLNVSKTTLISAFSQLQREGLLTSHPKSGYFINYNLENGRVNWNDYTRMARHKTSVYEYRHWGESDGLTNFSLSSDFHMEKYLVDAMRGASERISAGKTAPELTKYGLTSLRESIRKHLEKLGIKTKTENILISSETIQRLFHVYESLLNANSNFLYENTNIINTISNIHSIGMNMIPIKMDKHGMSAVELEKKLIKCKCCPIVHVDPTDQAPTGVVMSKRRRQEIMNIIQKYRVPLVEIDHSSNIWHDRPALNPLKSIDRNDNIIYLGSLLKCHPYDFQLSWIVADRFIIEHLSNVFIQTGVKPNFTMQLLVDEMIRSGNIYKMTEDISNFIRSRKELTLALCEKHLKSRGFWIEKNCNFHFWLDFPDVNFKNIFSKRELITNIYPGYFFDKNDTSHILLCPASIQEQDIEKTIIRLKDLVNENYRG